MNPSVNELRRMIWRKLNLWGEAYVSFDTLHQCYPNARSPIEAAKKLRGEASWEVAVQDDNRVLIQAEEPEEEPEEELPVEGDVGELEWFTE